MILSLGRKLKDRHGCGLRICGCISAERVTGRIEILRNQPPVIVPFGRFPSNQQSTVAQGRGLFLFDFHFFFVIRTDSSTDGLTFELIDRHNHFFLCVSDQGIDQTWVDARE